VAAADLHSETLKEKRPHKAGVSNAGGVCEGRSGSLSMPPPPLGGMPTKGDIYDPSIKGGPRRCRRSRYHVRSRRSGRVAEGGALLRRYGDECLHRGFESLLLRWRGGRAVECGGLENRYPSLGGSRVQIPPPPLNQAESRIVERNSAFR